MFDFLNQYIEYLLSSFHMGYFIDISLFSIFVFFVLKGVRARTTRPFVLGFTFLSMLYILSKFFDFLLLSLLLNGLVLVLLLVSIFAFQNDIRRMIEKPFLFFSKKNSKRIEASDIDLLLDAVYSLSAARFGALLVLKGKESLERHLQGGSFLRSKINRALILSLFDNRTPGHDGGMILDGEWITRFGCQLPLTINRSKIKNLGTRHSAAVGLSEKTDAMIVVVSEETGLISIAQNGALSYGVSRAELKNGLEVFQQRFTEDGKKQGIPLSVLLQNIGLCSLSFLISFIAWFMLTYEPGTTFRSLTLPVEFRNLASDLLIDKISTEEVKVTLAGPSRTVKNIEESDLKVLLNFKNAKKGIRTFTDKDFKLALPANVRLFKVKPGFITAQLLQMKRISVAVKPTLLEVPNFPLQIGEVEITPKRVHLLVPTEFPMEEVPALSTQAIQLQTFSAGEHLFRVPLILPHFCRLAPGESSSVQVRIHLLSPHASKKKSR